MTILPIIAVWATASAVVSLPGRKQRSADGRELRSKRRRDSVSDRCRAETQPGVEGNNVDDVVDVVDVRDAYRRRRRVREIGEELFDELLRGTRQLQRHLARITRAISPAWGLIAGSVFASRLNVNAPRRTPS
jgi:hypothetical protein